MRSIGNMLIDTSSMNHDVHQRYGILDGFENFSSSKDSRNFVNDSTTVTS